MARSGTLVRGAARIAVLVAVVAASFTLAWLLGAVSAADAASAGGQLTTPELEQRRDAPHAELDDVSRGLMCPSCDSTLDTSNSPAAERMRAYVRSAIDAGWTEAEIRRGLVEEYGGDESILAVPDASNGSGMAAWLVPVLVGLAALAGGLLVLRRWRSQARSASPPYDQAPSSSEPSPSPSTQSGSDAASSPDDAPSARY